ncbi:hypothetical protein [Chromatium okenii]|uniref:hypothetical protein n=1 Tax=Chromatium okenii TaxID=61644 RepID=UPI00155875AC|nr:hypothetical protein [Chromatium okenii]
MLLLSDLTIQPQVHGDTGGITERNRWHPFEMPEKGVSATPAAEPIDNNEPIHFS